MDPRHDALQTRLGHRFDEPKLLQRALTHRSFGADHNERLEFLGDAVLNLAVSSLLFERFAGSDEGDLTRVRAHLVREDSLHRAALALGLPEVLRLSEGEARGGGAQRPSILADAVEALVGAIYLDGGFDPALQLVRQLFGELIASSEADSWSKDPKTELQEWLQARRLPVPSYRIVATRGQAHAQTFEVECAAPTLGVAEQGEGRSRRAAEQEAARRLLVKLKASDRPGGPLRS
ncbi:ribonuclease III [Aquincola sp. S2]|uniref:Ribonuclease 3 n=1 Tax=Pseudaquabacterium terrae TaxID=2732868 RepID=A0ABX2EE04_9BURK|nr:ribonuclease III [Aquabacterium terrae]NRF66846.1 ribonuclease III [Aquabacterium terrae]